MLKAFTKKENMKKSGIWMSGRNILLSHTPKHPMHQGKYDCAVTFPHRNTFKYRPAPTNVVVRTLCDKVRLWTERSWSWSCDKSKEAQLPPIPIHITKVAPYAGEVGEWSCENFFHFEAKKSPSSPELIFESRADFWQNQSDVYNYLDTRNFSRHIGTHGPWVSYSYSLGTNVIFFVS